MEIINSNLFLSLQQPGINFDIPKDTNELYFFEIFFTDKLLEYLTDETNRYARDFFHVNKDKLRPSSDFKKWPENGISSGKMSAFLTLTFYFEIVKKNLLKSYWSTNSVLIIPFLRTAMSRVDIFNILSFLHCCNNSKYISKGQYGYNPKKKLGESLSTMKEKFSTLWTFWQHISIDEGTVQFKENIHFRLFNPIKQVWKKFSNFLTQPMDVAVALI